MTRAPSDRQPSSLLVPVTADVLAAYRRASRGPEWQAVSTAVRVLTGECAACHCRPTRLSGLDAAHLVSELELWALDWRERYLRDARNLAALCRRCHRAFDFNVGLIPPRRLAPGQVTRLRRRYQRYASAFHRLELARMKFVVTALAETAEVTA